MLSTDDIEVSANDRRPVAPARKQERPERRLRFGWIVLTWPVLVGVATVLGLRWQGGQRPVTVAIVGLTPALAFPLAFAVLGAWRSRSRVLRVATAVTTAVFLTWMNPVSAVVGCQGAAPPSAITVYTANVLFDVGRPSAIAESILANEADVIVLQEVRQNFVDELGADPRLGVYPHRVGGPAASGKIIWSRWPLSDVEVEPFVVSQQISATVESPQGSFRVTNVHTLAPAEPENVWAWQNQFRQLGQLDAGQPRILAGDFNATEDHRPLRQLLGQGWTDAHEPKGCGFDATWPTGRVIPFPIYRLDHVLITDDFEVLDVRMADPGGSDHVPVVAELRIGPAMIGSRAIEPTGS